jgi:preprotein translocase subunit SecF
MTLFPLSIFPYGSKIDFMRLRWIALFVAAALMVVSIGSIATRGFNFALDFTGGTVVELRFERPVEVDTVRRQLASAGFGNAQVQTFGSGSDLLIRLRPIAADGADAGTDATAAQVQRAVTAPGNPAAVLRSEFVGPQIGRELATNGVYALLFVVIGFMVYISFRFEWKFAVAATVTSLHDVLLVCGWFALTGRSFDLTVLAGVLSVMGFSINDTIVVFDRVRENFRGMRAAPFDIMNRSVNQTLSRTVITSFVTLLSVGALYFYGGSSLQGMAEALMIGIIIGTLSSIFVACPLLLWLNVNKQDLMPKARDEEALARRP